MKIARTFSSLVILMRVKKLLNKSEVRCFYFDVFYFHPIIWCLLLGLVWTACHAAESGLPCLLCLPKVWKYKGTLTRGDYLPSTSEKVTVHPPLKVLSSEMNPGEISFIRKAIIKELRNGFSTSEWISSLHRVSIFSLKSRQCVCTDPNIATGIIAQGS